MSADNPNPPPTERHWLPPEYVLWSSEDVYCHFCEDEHARLLEARPLHEGTRTYVLGRCASCRAVHKREVTTVIFSTTRRQPEDEK